jgi:hypothetical protein
MPTINVVQRLNPDFESGFAELVLLMEQINHFLEQGQRHIDLNFCQCNNLNPFILLPLFLLSEQNTPTFSFQIENTGFGNYLRNSLFDSGGLNHLQQERLDEYQGLTYAPIIRFPATRVNGMEKIRDSFLSRVNSLLIQQFNMRGRLLTAIMYILDEMINNIVDHSCAEEGFLLYKLFENNETRFLDVCLADTGVGLLGNYQQNRILPNEAQPRIAMSNALNGVSTKQRQEGGRGYGINTSKNMLTQGLRGDYLLYSGNTYYREASQINDLTVYELPDHIKWSGTLVLLRIPLQIGASFNPVTYYA